jgi:hypothetical protein
MLWVHRALTGIMDDYFEGYFSEEMIESQVVFIYCHFHVNMHFDC